MTAHEHRLTAAERLVTDRAHSPFGNDTFGRLAERFARFFGTPQFIIGQTMIVVAWIAVNAIALSLRWDPYPFILLNLAFSTQAAYAAPLILLAQTRQADRDKVAAEGLAEMADQQRAHVEGETAGLRQLLQTNTELTERIASLTAELHAVLCEGDGTAR
ncbi:MAG: hypothetical protein QOE10_1525, partial [Gaiellales bacterium]|nr:hypothetical protein [Gaiellales bacterium]